MSEIQMPARFVVCECGRHGHIVFSDGTCSKEVATVEDAFDELRKALEKGLVVSEETTVLTRQIKDSGLISKELVMFMAEIITLKERPKPTIHITRESLVNNN